MSRLITDQQIQEIVKYVKELPIPFKYLEPVCFNLLNLPEHEDKKDEQCQTIKNRKANKKTKKTI